MDPEQHSTLMDVFQGIPDPRKARGKRYPWLFLLTLIGAALTSGQQTAHAIAHWVLLHGTELHEHLQPPRTSMPSEWTIRRVLRGTDIDVLEQRLADHAQHLAEIGTKQGTITRQQGRSCRVKLSMGRSCVAYGPMGGHFTY